MFFARNAAKTAERLQRARACTRDGLQVAKTLQTAPFAANAVSTMLVGALLLWAGYAQASCWEQAAAAYGLDPLLLKAIGWQESRGWSHAVGPELAHSHHALGVMQINTVHLPALRAQGILRSDLFNPCVNQQVGAWVLADCMDKFGTTWRAVGCYYAGPRSKNFAKQAEYVRSVMRHYDGYRMQANSTQGSKAQAAVQMAAQGTP